jgi:hypothetical protein
MADKGNVCIRCGSKRIWSKKWKEEITTGMGTSTIIHNLYVCPQDECQKKVEVSLEEKKKVSIERELASLQREKDRIASRAKN